MPEKTTSRNAIIDAAADLIRTHGVQGMSISDVIAQSDTSAGAIYHHFPNKNAIVVEVARQTMAWPLAALAEYRDRPASPSELLAFAMGALATVPEVGEVLMQLGAGAGTDDQLGEQLRAEFATLRDSLEETMLAWAAAHQVPSERVRGYSQLLVGLALGYASQRALVERFDGETYRDQAVSLLALTP